MSRFSTYSQLYSSESPILTVKQVASFKQYQAAYAGGHLYVWNVIFGLGVGVGGRGFGVVRLEQASGNWEKRNKEIKFKMKILHRFHSSDSFFSLSLSLRKGISVVCCECVRACACVSVKS